MSKLTALLGFIMTSVFYAWAQTPAPSPAPGGAVETLPARDAAAGGIGGSFWLSSSLQPSSTS